MKILITGAGGFLGQYVVAEALRRGHNVIAMVRPASPVRFESLSYDGHCELLRMDLRGHTGLTEALSGVDVVVHLAATKTGDIYTQLSGTVVATENLLSAMVRARVRRVVVVSSFSVYGYYQRWTGARLDEDSPLESHPESRDEYCRTKLLQEKLIRNAAAQGAIEPTILRPGVIYGKGHLWTSRLGVRIDSDARGRKSAPRSLWICIGAYARLPLTYVENCAQAAVLAAETPAAAGMTLNVIDDELPTQRRYAGLVAARMASTPRIVRVPWLLMRVGSRVAWLMNVLCFHGKARVPGLIVAARLHARAKPLRYDNRRIKQALGWTPRYGLRQALDRSFGERLQVSVGAPRGRTDLNLEPAR